MAHTGCHQLVCVTNPASAGFPKKPASEALTSLAWPYSPNISAARSASAEGWHFTRYLFLYLGWHFTRTLFCSQNTFNA
jgi:hypothetical protein